MAFAFGPKILMDPMFALTFQEIKTKFTSNCKISKEACMTLKDNNCFFENLDLAAGTLVCDSGMKSPGPVINFEKCSDSDAEIYRIRGYKPKTN